MPAPPADEAFLRHWLQAQPAVAAYLLARTGDRASADDLLQDTALAAWRNFRRYDRARPFIGWALGIAKHKLVDAARRERPHWPLFDAEIEQRLEAAAVESVDTLHERARAMHACIRKLDERGRDIVMRFYCQGEEVSRIANTLQVAVSTVKVRLHRIRATLRACVERRLRVERGAAR